MGLSRSNDSRLLLKSPFSPLNAKVVHSRRSRSFLKLRKQLSWALVPVIWLAWLSKTVFSSMLDYSDPYYQSRREALFVIAVNCTRALQTCFCHAMGTGPKAQAGYDLVLTESDDNFLIQAGSQAGQKILRCLPLVSASERRVQDDDDRIAACAASQIRTVDVERLPSALYEAHDHQQWDHVATRCLACTNCTMVCPTCFCHTVQETTDLSHQHSQRTRLWDSCFTEHHGYIHGKNIRPTIKDRYRMWLTHKVASWIDQFGTSGCVGCGRCITWCPVGIDLTEELHALLGNME